MTGVLTDAWAFADGLANHLATAAALGPGDPAGAAALRKALAAWPSLCRAMAAAEALNPHVADQARQDAERLLAIREAREMEVAGG